MDVEKLGKETLLQHLGEENKLNGAVVAPLFQTSLFVFDKYADFAYAGSHLHEVNNFYSRIGNPTVELAEKKIAMLEGTERCKLVSSGMAAITVAILSCIKANSHVVAVDTCYGPVRDLLTSYLDRFGVTTTFVDATCHEELIDALTPETSLVYLESPSSLLFRLQDLSAITAECRRRGITTVIDNTYSTPLHQQPHKLGVDIVVHSATKYFGGHSDVVAGAICTTAEKMEPIIKREINLVGSGLAAFPAWLIIRGLRTLSLRLKRHEETANEVAAWLEDQPWVERVHHVSLPSFPQRDLYRRQMSGSGGLFSFEPKEQSEEAAIRFIEALEIFQLGVSWGGFESLSVQLHVQAIYMGGRPRRLIRLFTGLEDPIDLKNDLGQAAKIAYSASV